MDIDNLQIKISADTEQAIKSLKALANALDRIQKRSQNTGFDLLAAKVNHFAKACHNSIPDIERLGDAIAKISSLKQGTLASTAKQIKDTVTPNETIKSGTVDVEPEKNAVTDLAKAENLASAATKELADDFRDKNKALDEQTKKTKKDTTAVKGYGKQVQKTTKHLNIFNNSVFRILKYRMIRTALKAIAGAYKEGLDNLYQYSKNLEALDTSGGVSQTLDQLTSVLLQLKNTLGVTFGYLAITFQPLITMMSNGLMKLAESINILIADALGEKTFYRAKYNLKEYMDTAKETTKANKGLLQSFDELHNITTNNDNSIDPSDMFEQVEITDDLKNSAVTTIVDDLGKVAAALVAYQALKGAIKGVIDMFLGKNDALKKQTDLTDKDNQITRIFTKGLLFAGAAALLFKDQIFEVLKQLEIIPKTVEDALGGMMKKIQPAIEWINEQLATLKKAYDDTIGAIVEIFNSKLAEAQEAVDKVNQKISTIVQFAKEAFEKAKAYVEAFIEKTRTKFSTWQQNIKDSVDKVRTSITNAFTTIKDNVVGAIQKIIDKWNEMKELLTGGIGKVADGVKDAWDNITSGIGKGAEKGSNLFQSAADWLSDNRLTPGAIIQDTIDDIIQNPDAYLAAIGLEGSSALSSFFAKNATTAAKAGSAASGVTDISSIVSSVSDGAKAAIAAVTAGVTALGEEISSFFDKKKTKAYASGGFPSAGSLFLAGETGSPEMVGTINGRTAVANNDQITEAIASAVYNAIVSANGIGNTNVTIEGDMSKFLRVLKRSQYKEGLRVGTV